ncbi:hypothetical protein QM012_005605 [Aureobasidium pullulans]|uniref:ABC transporter domain-containing protein n=1 Tax=Aureobasidium pullulans TaxID=5580 RepID=A0ABR0T5K8_AURPU
MSSRLSLNNTNKSPSVSPPLNVSSLNLEAGHSVLFENKTISKLQWTNISVSVRARKNHERAQLLKSCSAQVVAGNLLALMGPSGSGKTTLLNVLAGRSHITFKGTIEVNDQEVSGTMIRRISSFVQQADTHLGGLTVEESIYFTSCLANPSMTKDEMKLRNDEVIEALGLRAQLKTLVSSPFRKSLSGGQMRRLSLATALITGPKILLLDEPTSGLDSAASFEVMSFISRFAKRYGLIVIASIHQPSTSTLELFDSVMLISGGQTCYFGPRTNLVPYFSRSHLIPLYCNPAEFLLELVNIDFCSDGKKAQEVEAIVREWQILADREVVSHTDRRRGLTLPFAKTNKVSTSYAFWILLRRNVVKSYRDPLVYGSRAAMNIALAFVIGTVWLRLPYEQSSIQPTINCLFFSSAFMGLMAVAYAPAIIEDIKLLQTEHANRLYTPLPFMIANLAIGVPWLVMVALSFSIATYWLTGLFNDSAAFGVFTMWLFVDLLAAESMIVLVAAIVPHFITALALASFANGLWLAVGGFLVPKNILNVFWRYAFHYIDFQTYVFQGMMVNQFRKSIYRCSDLKDGQHFCMFPSDLAAEGKIEGTAILDAYGYDYGPNTWAKWLGLSLAIVLMHRVVGLGMLYWRVRQL